MAHGHVRRETAGLEPEVHMNPSPVECRSQPSQAYVVTVEADMTSDGQAQVDLRMPVVAPDPTAAADLILWMYPNANVLRVDADTFASAAS